MLVHVRERSPSVDFWGLEDDLDRIFGSVFADEAVPAQGASFDFEVTPGADHVTLRAELPGIEPSAINIAVDDRALTVSAERAAEQRTDSRYHLRERAYGKFSRTFHLSDDLDPSAIDAECRDGILTVRVAKCPEAKPRQIAVQTS